MKPNIRLFVASFMMLAVAVNLAPAAQLVQVDPDPAGAFKSWQDGSIATRGPRYNLIHELLTIQNLGNDAWTGWAQDDNLVGFYGVGVSDPVYYPGLSWLALVDGSVFTHLTMQSGGGGGGEEFSAMSDGPSADGPVNAVQMNITQTLYLMVHPQTWQNEPGNTLGTHDNEIITLDNTYSVSTVNDTTGGYILFRIDPVLNEQIGDPVPLSLSAYASADVTHAYGNEGYTGYAQASVDILINGQPVTLGEGGYAELTASVGDLIAVKMDSMLYLRGSAVLQEPDSPYTYNKVFNPVYTLTSTGFNLAVPLTSGTTEYDPLLPANSPENPGPANPYVFEPLNIGSSGPGIDSPVWFDPDPAIAYQLDVAGAFIASVSLPYLWGDPDGFELWYFIDGHPILLADDVWPGETWTLPAGVWRILISDIDPDLMLDPADPLAFPLGITFDGPATGVQVSMAPLTLIPEPTCLSLLTLGSLLLLRRK